MQRCTSDLMSNKRYVSTWWTRPGGPRLSAQFAQGFLKYAETSQVPCSNSHGFRLEGAPGETTNWLERNHIETCGKGRNHILSFGYGFTVYVNRGGRKQRKTDQTPGDVYVFGAMSRSPVPELLDLESRSKGAVKSKSSAWIIPFPCPLVGGNKN